jgi:PadR family transcriptional regulator, regulatory protein AphA
LADLTTTSYAILGLLAIKPWTTYELAQQMERALNDFWPRTRSKLYEEPKKLVAHGLAKANAETVGRRPRTVYSITPKGRRTLAAWVATPPSAPGPSVEFEHLVKVFFAEFGSKDDLLATIGGLREWLHERARVGAEVAGGYVDGRGPFPERLPWLLLVGQFLDRFDQLVAEWVDWATETVEAWPDDITKAKPDLAILEHMARRNREVVAPG